MPTFQFFLSFLWASSYLKIWGQKGVAEGTLQAILTHSQKWKSPPGTGVPNEEIAKLDTAAPLPLAKVNACGSVRFGWRV